MSPKSLLKKLALYLGVASLIIVTSCNKDESPPMPEFVDFINAKISAGQEVPLTNSSATGTFTVKYDKTSNKLDYTINYTGLTPTAMHFHKGAVGVAGAVEQEVKGPFSSGMMGSITLTEAQEVDLLANNWYLNIHTAANPGGEIRGQVVPENIVVPDLVEFNNAKISASQEVPLTNSSATGTFTVKYDKTSNKLDYTINYTGLTPTAMHFHKGGVGVAGGVELAVAGPYTSGMKGSLTLTEAQEVDLLANNWYLNIHTAANPGGEIRGQVVPENFVFPETVEFKNFSISSTQEVPLSNSMATGSSTARYNKVSNQLDYIISYSGLTPTAMHFHKGGVGVAGGVELAVAGPYTSGMTGSLTLTEAQEVDLLANNWYLNVHTAANPGGEIRGQVVTENAVVFSNIALSGKEEMPSNNSTTTGVFNGLFNKTTKVLAYTVSVNGVTPSGMHLHKAGVGVNGPVEITITGMSGSTAALTAIQEADLLAGNLYFNAHSTAFPGGEVRGQVVTDKMAIFTNDINGANENPAVTTAAMGSFYGAYDKATKKLSYVITFTGVIPTAMHFHKGAVGVNGGVELAIAGPYSSGMAGTATLTDAQETDVLSGLWYINIHSNANPGGEIRGQLIK